MTDIVLDAHGHEVDFRGVNRRHVADGLRWHAENPQVYDELVRFGRELLAAGHKRFSIRLLFHRARWESLVSTKADEGYKINDRFSAFYARYIMSREPDFEGVFETRRRTP